MSLGGFEIAIIVVIVVLLFGPTIAAFFIGYQVGKNRGSKREDGGATATEPREVPPADDAAPKAAD